MSSFNTIVISGASNVGKTTVLKMVSKVFAESKCAVPIDKIPSQKKDYWCSFEIDGKKLGIITFGDKSYYIKRAFHYLGKCDYYICASHLYGETIKAIFDLKDEYNIINPLFINKVGTLSNDKIDIDKDNSIFLKQLLMIVNRTLNINLY